MRCELPQVFARSAIVCHFQENGAAQMSRLLVTGVDVQRFVDEFEGLIQPAIGQVEP